METPMFKRDARPQLKTPRELLAMTETEVRALSDAELDALVEHFRRGHIVQKERLYHGCIDGRCRRMRTCTSGTRSCLCANVPPMSKRDLERATGSRRRKPPRMRF
jgi:hypothetical protein